MLSAGTNLARTGPDVLGWAVSGLAILLFGAFLVRAAAPRPSVATAAVRLSRPVTRPRHPGTVTRSSPPSAALVDVFAIALAHPPFLPPLQL